MRLLLDTHALLWWWCCPQLLSPRVRARLKNPCQAVVVSVASLWELSEAEQRAELPELSPVIWQLPELVLAQAQLENLTLVSADTTLRRSGVRCLW
jgi:PIN domain nuclease of toxin-antitoxin system